MPLGNTNYLSELITRALVRPNPLERAEVTVNVCPTSTNGMATLTLSQAMPHRAHPSQIPPSLAQSYSEGTFH
jgi:hypothetical protein